jgi:hypothetical protein
MSPVTRLADIHACPVCPADPAIGSRGRNVLTSKRPQAALDDPCAGIGLHDPDHVGLRPFFLRKRPAVRIVDAAGRGGLLILGLPVGLTDAAR